MVILRDINNYLIGLGNNYGHLSRSLEAQNISFICDRDDLMPAAAGLDSYCGELCSKNVRL